MTIHREGRVIILVSILILGSVMIGVLLIPVALLFRLLIILPLLIILFLVLWFFRIPDRKCLPDDRIVYAPADGKIVVIEKTTEQEYFKDARIQISIFMSPLNVHQNIYPIGGTVCYTKYHKGDYLVAWHPKSSTQNERSTVVIRNKRGIEILVRQIAGAVARRICTYAQTGDIAEQGKEFGFIKFGSRVDVFLPLDASIECSLNQVSINKHTILAKLKV
jgi:phosphatidylserine decarboxylase